MPILIQWLHRRNYTERVWAAMRFLRAATKAQSRRLRFESLLLLIIRTLIILLVALALAEPFLESNGWLPQEELSVHRLLVIDTSLSMQYETEGRLLMDRARDAARRIVSDGRAGDSYQIVTIGREGRSLIRQPSFDPAQVLAEIDELTATEQFGNVPQSLQLAHRLLDEASARGAVRATIISDFQSSNWWPQQRATRVRLQQSITELAEAAELSFVRVGDESAVNAAVGALAIDPPLVTSGASVQISAPIRVEGVSGSRSVKVELVEGDRVLQTKTVDVPAAGEAAVSFAERWREAGPHGLEVRLPNDGLAADNHRWGVVNVRSDLAVLLVNGRESAETLGRATDYLELALTPPANPSAGSGDRRGFDYRPVVISEAELTRTELADFDCIVLCDVPFLSTAEVSRLQSFVRGGGGIIIGVGPQVQLDFYNQWLSRNGSGLMPVSLVEVVGDDAASEQPYHFADGGRAHPIVEPFIGNPQAGLTTANIYRYIRVQTENDDARGVERERADRVTEQREMASDEIPIPESGFSRVAVSFSNGDPAIIESRYGAGRALLVTTSLDDQWGSWALWPSFLPMVHRMVQYVSEAATASSQEVGTMLRREYAVQSVGLPVTIQQPDGRRGPAQTRLQDGATVVTYDEASRSGVYRLILGPPLNAIELMAVNVDARESDLARLSEAELQKTLLDGVDAELMTGLDGLTTQGLVDRLPSRVTRWLLAVALILLFVEQVMAWQPRYGIYALAASPLLLMGLLLTPVVTLILLGLGIGLAAVMLRHRQARSR